MIERTRRRALFAIPVMGMQLVRDDAGLVTIYNRYAYPAEPMQAVVRRLDGGAALVISDDAGRAGSEATAPVLADAGGGTLFTAYTRFGGGVGYRSTQVFARFAYLPAP